ncbi:hypothetical protein Y032_0121g1002 [Ancylostoma ceylanicum]|uniref:Uncharacterized protein n=1 Tax=Ancylostoma ceylanicum TaxID=53326 RepID=A0A016TAC1_9BILA|nr:hypothetical protein Y032_0121g1002 [Ancylostoma ceylanicum]
MRAERRKIRRDSQRSSIFGMPHCRTRTRWNRAARIAANAHESETNAMHAKPMKIERPVKKKAKVKKASESLSAHTSPHIQAQHCQRDSKHVQTQGSDRGEANNKRADHSVG